MNYCPNSRHFSTSFGSREEPLQSFNDDECETSSVDGFTKAIAKCINSIGGGGNKNESYMSTVKVLRSAKGLSEIKSVKD